MGQVSCFLQEFSAPRGDGVHIVWVHHSTRDFQSRSGGTNTELANADNLLVGRYCDDIDPIRNVEDRKEVLVAVSREKPGNPPDDDTSAGPENCRATGSATPDDDSAAD